MTSCRYSMKITLEDLKKDMPDVEKEIKETESEGRILVQACSEVLNRWADETGVTSIKQPAAKLTDSSSGINSRKIPSAEYSPSFRFVHSKTAAPNWTAPSLNSANSSILVAGGLTSYWPPEFATIIETFHIRIPIETCCDKTRSQCQVVLLKNTVYGFSQASIQSAFLLGLDLPGNTWRFISKRPCANYNFSWCQLDNPKLLLSSGGLHFDIDFVHSVNTSYLLDLETIQWKEMPFMQEHRQLHSMTLLNGMPTAIGGGNCEGTTEYLILGGGHDRWISGRPLLKNRLAHCAISINRTLVVAGGVKEETAMRSVETFDWRMNNWQQGPPLNQKRSFFAMIEHNGKLYAIGGRTERTIGHKPLETTEWWDLRWPKWNQGPSLTQPRFNHGAVVVPNKLLLSADNSQP